MSTFPIHKVAKNIAETGVSWLTEHQLTEKIFEHAQRDRASNETPEQAFARVEGMKPIRPAPNAARFTA
jgi:hypothetical protein